MSFQMNFYKWLMRQAGREDPVGDIARDVATADLPRGGRDIAAIRAHLIITNAGTAAFKAFSLARAESGPRRVGRVALRNTSTGGRAVIHTTYQTEHALRKILAGVTFERSHFSAWDIRFEVCHAVLSLPDGGGRPHLIGWHVRLAFDRPDAGTGAMGTGHSRPEFVGTGADETSVVKTCLLLAKLIAEHEMCEAFHYRGARVFDPHLTLDRLRAASAPSDPQGAQR